VDVARRYFAREQRYLLPKLIQARRKRLDHELLDAGFAIPANLIDDGIWVAVESGRGISVLNRSAHPGLHPERKSEVGFVPDPIHHPDRRTRGAG
jgi:hypothetical protein